MKKVKEIFMLGSFGIALSGFSLGFSTCVLICKVFDLLK